MALVPIDRFINLLPEIQKSPDGSLWLHYDAESDTLYVNFRRPSHAADSDLTDDDVIIRYDESGEVIGYTILHFQQRVGQ